MLRVDMSINIKMLTVFKIQICLRTTGTKDKRPQLLSNRLFQ